MIIGKIPRVVVIGGGIAGAATVWSLARAEIDATLIETAGAPARGVTAQAFGWINLVHCDPAHAAAYELQRAAVAEHEALVTAFPEAYVGMRRGSLLWRSSESETETLIAGHAAAGTALRTVSAREIAAIEPALREPPRLAAFAADDMALDASALATRLVGDAAARGAHIRLDERATGIVTRSGSVAAVETSGGRIAAECVVVAAGPATEALLAPLGITLGLSISPVRLLRFATTSWFVRRIVETPELEIRQREDRTVLVPVAADGEDADAASAAAAAIKRQFTGVDGLRFIGAATGQRPIFADRIPRIGFVPEIGGLLTAVGHPGVILAPLMGRMIAAEITAAFGAPRPS